MIGFKATVDDNDVTVRITTPYVLIASLILTCESLTLCLDCTGAAAGGEHQARTHGAQGYAGCLSEANAVS